MLLRTVIVLFVAVLSCGWLGAVACAAALSDDRHDLAVALLQGVVDGVPVRRLAVRQILSLRVPRFLDVAATWLLEALQVRIHSIEAR